MHRWAGTQVVYNVFSGAGRPKFRRQQWLLFNDNSKLEGTVDIRNPGVSQRVLTVNGKGGTPPQNNWNLCNFLPPAIFVLRDNQVRNQDQRHCNTRRQHTGY